MRKLWKKIWFCFSWVPKGTTTINFFKNPGKLTIQEVLDYCATFWNDAVDAAEVQNGVRSNMMHNFVYSSMSNDVYSKIEKYEDHLLEYEIQA